MTYDSPLFSFEEKFILKVANFTKEGLVTPYEWGASSDWYTVPLSYMIYSVLFMPPFCEGRAVLAGEKLEIDNASCIQSLPIILEYSSWHL